MGSSGRASFNAGVELGQLSFVLGVAALSSVLRPALPTSAAGGCDESSALGRVEVAVAYLVGAVGMFWVIERTAAFWS